MTLSKRQKILLRIAVVNLSLVVFTVSFFIERNGLYHEIFAAAGIAESKTYNYVRFLDVGQGDATLFYSDGSFVLVDCGNSLDGGKIIARKLMSLGIKKLDYLICSHSHNDHIGGASKILEKIDVGCVAFNKNTPEYNGDAIAVNILEKAAADKNVTVLGILPGKTICFGNCKIDAVWLSDKTDENDNSIVLIAECDEKRFFLGGDISSSVEKQMVQSGMDVSCYVLKASHHGSKNSTSDLFLNAAKPKYCVVSCGEDNMYGFPSKEFCSRIKSHGVKLYTTAENGDVIFNTSAKSVVLQKK